MVQKLIQDTTFLALPSGRAKWDDLQIGLDLLDTLRENQEEYLGLSANMIGHGKNIIAFQEEGRFHLMFNPVILGKDKRYRCKEPCFSHTEENWVYRYEFIHVKWQNPQFHWVKRSFSGLVAQVIQHELDHCEGIVIPGK